MSIAQAEFHHAVLTDQMQKQIDPDRHTSEGKLALVLTSSSSSSERLSIQASASCIAEEGREKVKRENE